MPKIYFTSGKALYITPEEFSRIGSKLNGGGIRVMRFQSGELMPLNSNTIELISPQENLIDEVSEPENPIVEPEKPTPAEVEVMQEKVEKKEVREVPEEESKEERIQKMKDDFMAKANCVHSEKEIYKVNTAKGERFFPVCIFCGKRERYVKADSLEPAVKLNAKVWEEG